MNVFGFLKRTKSQQQFEAEGKKADDQRTKGWEQEVYDQGVRDATDKMEDDVSRGFVRGYNKGKAQMEVGTAEKYRAAMGQMTSLRFVAGYRAGYEQGFEDGVKGQHGRTHEHPLT